MQKLLIITLGLSTLLFGGCSTDRIADRISEKLPWVYKIDVQQGNVVTQEQVNQLAPGMDQRQVQHILGTPMITDPFHQDRWDYPYSFQADGEVVERSRLTVYFEKGALTGTEGSLRPQPEAERTAPVSRQMTVTVPYQEHKKAGLLTRFWRWITFGGDQEGS
jgi:outer membrane protein assembly factor BamE